MREAGSR
jgi:hypothetical protein